MGRWSSMFLPWKSRTVAAPAAPLVGRHFVNRRHELDRFLERLREGQRIVNVSGEFGLGKSELLRRLEQEALTSPGTLTAASGEDAESIPRLLHALARQFEGRGDALRTFDRHYATYRQKQTKSDAGGKLPKEAMELAAVSISGALKAGLGTIGGPAAALIPTDQAAKAAVEGLQSLHTRRERNDELEIEADVTGVLTSAFLQDVGGLPSARVAVFIDVADGLLREADAWLLRIARGEYGQLPSSLVIVVATRRELDPARWANVPWLERLPLSPLVESDARDYLRLAGIADDRVVAEILRRTSRTPLQLAMIAARRPQSVAEIPDVSSDLVNALLSSVADDRRRQLALNAAVLRIINRDALAAMTASPDVGPDFNWLVSQPFVRDTDRGRAYMNEVRPQVIRRLRLDAPQSFSELHLRLADYYEKIASAVAGADGEHRRDPQWQSADLERLYHRAAGAPRAALADALNGFLRTLGAGRAFLKHYAETLRQAGVESEFEPLAAIAETMVRGVPALDGDQSTPAIEMFTALIDSRKLEPAQRARALDWRGYLRFRGGAYADALRDVDAALALEPAVVEYLCDRALTLQGLGRFAEAQEALNAAAAIEPQNVPVLLLRAALEQLDGRYEQALDDVGRVLAVEPMHGPARVLHGELLQILGRVSEALDSLAAATAREPADPELLLAHARILLVARRVPEAVTVLDRLAVVAAGNYPMLSGRAALLAMAGEAERAAQAAHELSANAVAAAESISRLMRHASPEEQARRVPLTAALYDTERSDLTRMIPILRVGGPPAIRVLQADAALLEALAWIHRGDWDRALEACNRGINLDPERPSAWRMRSLPHLIKNDLPQALADLDRTLALAPDDSLAHTGRSRILLMQGDADGALAAVTRAVELRPKEFASLDLRREIRRLRNDLAGVAADAAVIAENAAAYVDTMARYGRIAGAALWTALKARAGASDPSPDEPTAPSAQELMALIEQDRAAAIALVVASAAHDQAVAAVVSGDHDLAIRCWTQAIERSGRRPFWLGRRAESYRLAGAYAEALADLDAAIESASRSAWLRATRAQVYRALGRRADAEVDMDLALEQSPQLVWARTERAQWRIDDGRPADAVIDLDAVLAVQPTAVAALGRRATVLASIGRGDEALRDIDALLLIKPDAYEAIACRIGILRDRGDIGGALANARILGEHVEAFATQLMNLTSRIPPSGLPAATAMPRAAGEVATIFAGRDRAEIVRMIQADIEEFEALACEQQLDFADAVTHWDGAVTLGGGTALRLGRRGNARRLLGQFADALADLNAALALTADDPWLRATRGQVFRAMNQDQAAMDDLTAALDVDPSMGWVWSERAAVHRSRAAFDRAIADAMRAVELIPTEVVALTQLGDLLGLTGSYDAAIDVLTRALTLAADDLPSRFFRGCTFRLMGRYREAIADLARVVELRPDAEDAGAALAEALLLDGRCAEAVAAATNAVTAAPDFDWALYVQGVARLGAADPDAARSSFDAALVKLDARTPATMMDRFNAALYRLARGGPGDCERAEREYAECAAAATDVDLRPALANLEALAAIAPNDAVTRLAGTLRAALARRPPATALGGGI
jgi:tetratricopeptide (TPR) repeat protein